MDSGKSKSAAIFPPPKQEQLQLNFLQAFANLQRHCSSLFNQFSNLHLFEPNPSSFKTHLQCLQKHAKHALDAGVSRFDSAGVSGKSPAWARIAAAENTAQSPAAEAGRRSSESGASMSNEAIAERLAGVPVYALSNASEEFVLVSGSSTAKSLGLFCFRKEDAETLLEQIRSMDPRMQSGSKVVAVALNKVFQLKVDGVAFRFIPESSQVKNALKEREKSGIADDGFLGVPVFQSKSLILRSQKKSYRPAFFRKEDLENSLLRASRQQNQLNPALRQGDIEVAVLEEVIKGMKESSESNWGDVVFIPPGFDVSTDPTEVPSK